MHLIIDIARGIAYNGSMIYVLLMLAVVLVGIVAYDLWQKKHAILRNFPILGHFRYLLEAVGPELRQYIVTNNDEERPFSRDQRSWIYATSKKQNNLAGFGTDNNIEMAPKYLILKNTAIGFRQEENTTPEMADNPEDYSLVCLKTMGAASGRKKTYQPQSIVNISGMSYGSLSGRAVSALNKAALLANCYHNTGEGGISTFHQHGGDLVWNIGTAYFGCRDSKGNFSLSMLKDKVEANNVKAIEIKLSQGAKPNLGGVLPAAKVTPEIARARGVPVGEACISPRYHKEFRCPDSLLDFVEKIASETGLPVGVKAAIGETDFWTELAERMKQSNRLLDFITIDGGEGGTGAGPLVFADRVGLPFKLAFTRIYKIFKTAGLEEKIVFIGSGKLGLPENALFALAMGCDAVNVAREAMLALGCIQSQKCHLNTCPTGVATQSKWLERGIDVESKSVRVANYIKGLRKELLQLAHACGEAHPAKITKKNISVIENEYAEMSLDVFK